MQGWMDEDGPGVSGSRACWVKVGKQGKQGGAEGGEGLRWSRMGLERGEIGQGVAG